MAAECLLCCMSCSVHKLLAGAVIRCVQFIVWLYLPSALSDRLHAICHDKMDSLSMRAFLKVSSVEEDLKVSCIIWICCTSLQMSVVE
jgi:hypothetical protein